MVALLHLPRILPGMDATQLGTIAIIGLLIFAGLIVMYEFRKA